MAKGKKSSGNSYTSKGLYPTVGKKEPRVQRNPMERLKNQQKAWAEGKPVSRRTLLMYGPRTTQEQHLHAQLRKAIQGKRTEMDINIALKGV